MPTPKKLEETNVPTDSIMKGEDSPQTEDGIPSAIIRPEALTRLCSAKAIRSSGGDSTSAGKGSSTRPHTGSSLPQNCMQKRMSNPPTVLAPLLNDHDDHKQNTTPRPEPTPPFRPAETTDPLTYFRDTTMVMPADAEVCENAYPTQVEPSASGRTHTYYASSSAGQMQRSEGVDMSSPPQFFFREVGIPGAADAVTAVNATVFPQDSGVSFSENNSVAFLTPVATSPATSPAQASSCGDFPIRMDVSSSPIGTIFAAPVPGDSITVMPTSTSRPITRQGSLTESLRVSKKLPSPPPPFTSRPTTSYRSTRAAALPVGHPRRTFSPLCTSASLTTSPMSTQQGYHHSVAGPTTWRIETTFNTHHRSHQQRSSSQNTNQINNNDNSSLSYYDTLYFSRSPPITPPQSRSQSRPVPPSRKGASFRPQPPGERRQPTPVPVPYASCTPPKECSDSQSQSLLTEVTLLFPVNSVPSGGGLPQESTSGQFVFHHHHHHHHHHSRELSADHGGYITILGVQEVLPSRASVIGGVEDDEDDVLCLSEWPSMMAGEPTSPLTNSRPGTQHHHHHQYQHRHHNLSTAMDWFTGMGEERWEVL